MGREHFNPRSPCGERRAEASARKAAEAISIHAPRVGSDRLQQLAMCWPEKFQSTLPVWGATSQLLPRIVCRRDFNPRSPCGERRARPAVRAAVGIISIHAPRGGRDTFFSIRTISLSHFNPRSPWGERQQRCTIVAWHLWRKVIDFSGDFHFRGIEDPQHPAETAFHAQKSVRTSRKFLCASASHYKISVSSG